MWGRTEIGFKAHKKPSFCIPIQTCQKMNEVKGHFGLPRLLGVQLKLFRSKIEIMQGQFGNYKFYCHKSLTSVTASKYLCCIWKR